MGDLSTNFSTAELECPHCDRCKVAALLILSLEAYRKIVKLPVKVLSCCRCEEHNKAVGGVQSSEHVFRDGDNEKWTEAADIRVPGLSLQEMYDAAMLIPAFRYGGIGVYDGGFIHVDVRDRVARWARVKGKYVSIAESKLVQEPAQ